MTCHATKWAVIMPHRADYRFKLFCTAVITQAFFTHTGVGRDAWSAMDCFYWRICDIKTRDEKMTSFPKSWYSAFSFSG